MDPLSLAAGVIAVIQISNTVLLCCYRLRNQIKDAGGEISQIITEAEDLSAILNELDEVLQPAGDGSGLEDLSLGEENEKSSRPTSCQTALTSCEAVLKEISKKLAPISKPGLKSKLRWPFESGGVQQKLDILQRQKVMLQLALSTYQTRVLTRQSRKLTESHHVVVGLQDHTNQTRRATILNWYKSSDPEQNHRVSRGKHEPNTANWIFDLREFQSWASNSGESLWLHGIPGAGKTVLCSTIIDRMQERCQQDSSARVAYYYFDFADSKKQTLTSFLKSIIYQLASVEEVVSESVAELYSKHDGLQEPRPDELLEVLISELAHPQTTYLLIDALDECSRIERQNFLDGFLKYSLPSNLNVLITSRKEPDIEEALRDSFSHNICIQSSMIDSDVRTHVSNVISRDPLLQKWKPVIQQEILEAIVQGSHGMFRWAVCQLETMKKCLTPAMIRAELKRMPETLDQTYDRILQNVPGLHQRFVQSALHWLAFSTRPLLLKELAEAAVIDPDTGKFDPNDSRLVDETLILDLCGTLVTSSVKIYDRSASSDDWLNGKIRIEYGSSYPHWSESGHFDVISLSHFSVKEYISSERLQKTALFSYFASERIANTFLAECCLLYLLDYYGGEISPSPGFKEYHLLEYSAVHWMDHWKLAENDKENSLLRGLLYRLFDPFDRNAYVNWLNTYSPDCDALENDRWFYDREIVRSPDLHVQPLYWASWLGYLPLVRLLVEQGCDVSATGGYFGSALAAAALRGHKDVVEYLLSSGADPNAQSGAFGTVLQVASVGGCYAAVKLLVDAGADINSQGGEYNTALIAAATHEHNNVVALLIENGANIDIGSRMHGTTLYQAALAGDVKMVTIFLLAGADVNEIGDSDGTALYAAARSGSIPLVRTLIRSGADVNKGGLGQHGYPLIAAAEKGHSRIAEILLRAGADVNISKGRRKISALEAAVESADMVTFRVILEAGADPNIHGGTYINCFHAALWTGGLEMARILLERDAEFEDEAFLEAVSRYDQDPWFFQKMLERSANIDAFRENQGSALHIAIEGGCEEAARLLLSRDPYLDAVSENGSILGAAIGRQMVDVAKELLRRGVDIHRRGKYQGPPFDRAVGLACQLGSFELANLLFEMGADVNGGRGVAAYIACENENTGVLRYLADKGVDLNLIIDSQKCTPLQLAARGGKLPVIRLLLELGADVNGNPGEGGSTIHYALHSRNESVVRFIMDNGALLDDSFPGLSILCKAIKSGLLDLVPLLLEKGANVNKEESSWTPVALAFSKKRRDVVELLMDRGANFADAGPGVLLEAVRSRPLAEIKELLDYGVDPNSHGGYKTPITIAAEQGKRDVVELLLDYGADPNANVGVDRGPLALAAASGDIAMVEFLLERGADPNLIKKGYRYPLYDAIAKGNLQLVDLLLGHGADISINGADAFGQAIWCEGKVLPRLLELDMTVAERERYLDRALQNAAHYANLNICKWLLDHGANLNFVGGEHGSPLLAALSNPQVSIYGSQANDSLLILNMFLERGANINGVGQSSEFRSPLIMAIENRAAKYSQILLSAGADPNIGGGDLHSPLQAAARHRQSMVRPLLAAGADVSAVGGRLGTALHAAAYAHDCESIELLLQHGADVNIIAGKYGSTIQAAAKRNSVSSGHWTASRQSVHAMQALYDHGALVTVEAGKYCTALQMAAKSGNLEAVKWLLGHGADPHIKGGEFGTALKGALKKERWAVISYLEQHFGRDEE
ncbi:MAG: hypothetical protein M1839_002320 [Geoglossum umbratile]|nr:MAG: hypothetical protein M1839_002320 [Geoglossum umbratile]